MVFFIDGRVGSSIKLETKEGGEYIREKIRTRRQTIKRKGAKKRIKRKEGKKRKSAGCRSNFLNAVALKSPLTTCASHPPAWVK